MSPGHRARAQAHHQEAAAAQLVHLVAPVNATSHGKSAMAYAHDLACRLHTHSGARASHVQLTLLLVVAINPVTTTPYMDRLEASYNLEIVEEAKQSIAELQSYLQELNVSAGIAEGTDEGEAMPHIELVVMKEPGVTGPLICKVGWNCASVLTRPTTHISRAAPCTHTKQYIESLPAPPYLCIIGTRNNGRLSKWAFGSVSDYCLHHLPCPVSIIKDHSGVNEGA
jgi:nucleotide-binding universal stress UspA family protein